MTRPNVLPSAICTASAPRIGIFRGSMAGLCAPLSTLRRNPRGQLRMTRGRCGSLLLHRKRLALSTPCRSPGASQMFSGLPLKADIAQYSRHVSKVPIADNRHLIRALRQFGPAIVAGIRCHSITSSASESRLPEMAIPSAFAVLRLMISSNLSICCTGSSEGFVPFRMFAV